MHGKLVVLDGLLRALSACTLPDSQTYEVHVNTPQVTVTNPPASKSPAGLVRTYRWLIGVWVVVAMFALVTAYRSHEVGLPVRDPGGSIFVHRFELSLAIFAGLLLVDAAARTARPGWTIAGALATLRRRWPKDRLIVALSGLLAYHLVYLCYRNIKSWLAFRTMHDDDLLSLDKWFFFGHSPAVLLHDVFGEQLAAHVFRVIYESFSFMVPVSFVAALVFANEIRKGYVFLTSAMWVWIFGVGSYYLIPTIGPFYSAAKEFAGLDHTLITATQAKYMGQRAHFLADPSAHNSFVSLAAFASLHIGFTCMVLFMFRYYGFRRVARWMTVYLFAVMLATVYLGWHFAIDDVAGVILAYLAVQFGRRTIYPRGEKST